MGAGTAMVERLQAQVKQKDGEILLLQVSFCMQPFIVFDSATVIWNCPKDETLLAIINSDFTNFITSLRR